MEKEFLHIIYSINTNDMDKFPDCEKIPYFFPYPSIPISKRATNYWIHTLDAAGYKMEVNLMGKIYDMIGPVYKAIAQEGFPASYVMIVTPIPRAAPYKFVFQPVTDGNVNGALLRTPVINNKGNKKLDWKKEYPKYPEDEREMTPERKDILESIYEILDRDDET